MNISATISQLYFYENIDMLLLITVRCTGFFVLLPIFSGANIPAQTKIALGLFMSYIVFTSGIAAECTYDPTTFGYFYLLIIEFLTGFVLAFAVYAAFMVFFLAGQLIDYQIGYSMVSVLDPVSQIQVPVTGNLIYMFIMLFLIQTGGLNHIVGAFLHGFEVVPLGSAAFLSNASLIDTAIASIVSYFVIAVKIAMPVVGTILVLDVALGILVKAAPQMNIFVVGMPIKLLIGLIVFLVVIPMFSFVYEIVFSESYKNFHNFLEGMRTG